jgi:hypothetical protein
MTGDMTHRYLLLQSNKGTNTETALSLKPANGGLCVAILHAITYVLYVRYAMLNAQELTPTNMWFSIIMCLLDIRINYASNEVVPEA